MRVLLSVVGTRGDVQPLIALAIEVRELGHHVTLCVPPNFMELSHHYGFTASPVGIEMRAPPPGTPPQPVPDLITDQFEKIGAAADGCDIIVGANAHQYAARSIAALRDIPYVSAVYAPTALPDDANTRTFNERSLERVNTNRIRLGLDAISDLLRHIIGDQVYLATDPILDPPPAVPGIAISQTGAWILPDSSPLPPDVEKFLDAGEAPIYIGFGSMPVAEGTGQALIEAARFCHRRALVSLGWGNLAVVGHDDNYLSIDDVNHSALFPRVAAVVHHGGAGTTHAAALAGVTQVVIPMFSDQPHWAGRVRELGIGSTVPIAALSADTMAVALHDSLKTDVVNRARLLASQISTNGAAAAARRMLSHQRN